MIEVFKTNVDEPKYADILVEHIQRVFYGYEANFDLQDCDKILRVKNVTGNVNTHRLIEMLNRFGFDAEVLRDDYPASGLFIRDLNRQTVLGIGYNSEIT
jgi:hypothetical protein